MIIYGWKQYVQVLAVLRLVCGQCGNASEHVLRKLTTKFTLFWIPLFPIGKKHTLFCTACENEQRIPGAQAQQMSATGGAGMPPALDMPAMAGPATPPPGLPGPGMPAPAMVGPGGPQHGGPGMRPGAPMPGPGMPPPNMGGPYPGGPGTPPPGMPGPYGPRQPFGPGAGQFPPQGPPPGYPPQGGQPYPPRGFPPSGYGPR